MKISFLFITAFLALALSPTFSQDSIPNSGFEDWFNPNYAIDWQTTNGLLPAGLVNCFQTNNSHTGDFAMQMKTIDLAGNLIPAVASLGTVGIGFTEGGIPFTGKPVALHVYVRHPSTGNEVFIAAEFFNSGESIGGGSWSTTDSLADYTEITIPINFSGTLNPDTLNITLLTDAWTEGSMMQVDDLGFEYLPTVSPETQFSERLLFFPNPCSNQLFYKYSGNIPPIMEIYNSNGRRMVQQQSKGQTIETGSYPAGLYIVHYSMDGNEYRYKFIKR